MASGRARAGRPRSVSAVSSHGPSQRHTARSRHCPAHPACRTGKPLKLALSSRLLVLRGVVDVLRSLPQPWTEVRVRRGLRLPEAVDRTDVTPTSSGLVILDPRATARSLAEVAVDRVDTSLAAREDRRHAQVLRAETERR